METCHAYAAAARGYVRWLRCGAPSVAALYQCQMLEAERKLKRVYRYGECRIDALFEAAAQESYRVVSA